MGWISMSERDLKRIDVLTEALAERRTVVSAAATLALAVSERKDFLASASAMQHPLYFDLRRVSLQCLLAQD